MSSNIRPDTTHWIKVLSGHRVFDVAVHEWSVENPSATAFCMHGFAGNSQDFALLATNLKKEGIATFAIDMPGRGSSAFLGDPQLYTMRLQQLVLEEAIALTHGPLFLVGTSWGGVTLGAMAPYLPRAISGLVLVDTPLVSQRQTVFPYEDFLKDEAQAHFGTIHSARVYYAATRNLFHLPEDVLDQLLAAAVMTSGEGYRMRMDAALAGTIGRRPPFDIGKSIAKTKTPTLAVIGKNSYLYSAPEQVAARSALPSLSECIVEHEAHPPSLTQASQIEAISTFMTGSIKPLA
jgi:pimeloyl-ACP methyl ester carboxylesterase